MCYGSYGDFSKWGEGGPLVLSKRATGYMGFTGLLGNPWGIKELDGDSKDVPSGLIRKP